MYDTEQLELIKADMKYSAIDTSIFCVEIREWASRSLRNKLDAHWLESVITSSSRQVEDCAILTHKLPGASIGASCEGRSEYDNNRGGAASLAKSSLACLALALPSDALRDGADVFDELYGCKRQMVPLISDLLRMTDGS